MCYYEQVIVFRPMTSENEKLVENLSQTEQLIQ